MNLTVDLPRGFSFAGTVTSHGWYQLAPFQWLPESATLLRAEWIGGKAVDLRITATDSKLLIATGSPLTGREVTILRPRIARMFQLHVDLADFHARCAQSAPHRWAREEAFGRLLCGSTFFEDVVKVIATTNTAWSQTKRMAELLVTSAALGTKGGALAFPDAEIIAGMSEDDLRACRFGYRAAYVRDAAAMLVDPAFEEELADNVLEAPSDRLRRYRRLPGIGPYGAAHLMAMEGRHDFIAVDTEFRRFVRERYHGGRTVSDATMLRRYTKWGRWQYLAYWSELWRG